MDITLQYFDGCPNWMVTDGRLKALIEDEGLDARIRYQPIETFEAAVEHEFRGSPTVLIDGKDPFAEHDAPVGLSCRIYLTDDGPAGSPTLQQLQRAVTVPPAGD